MFFVVQVVLWVVVAWLALRGYAVLTDDAGGGGWLWGAAQTGLALLIAVPLTAHAVLRLPVMFQDRFD